MNKLSFEMTGLVTLAQLLIALMLLGCGDEAGELDGGATREGYPNCYGVTEGEIIDNLDFINPDGTEFKLSDIYDDSNNRLLLVSTSAGWCTACIEEQPSLAALHEEYSEAGLFVMVSVFEDSQFEPADAEFAARWVDQYELPFKVVADTDFVLDAYYDSSLTPMNMLVDIDTMEIVRIMTGFDESVVRAIIEAKL